MVFFKKKKHQTKCLANCKSLEYCKFLVRNRNNLRHTLFDGRHTDWLHAGSVDERGGLILCVTSISILSVGFIYKRFKLHLTAIALVSHTAIKRKHCNNHHISYLSRLLDLDPYFTFTFWDVMISLLCVVAISLP